MGIFLSILCQRKIVGHYFESIMFISKNGSLTNTSLLLQLCLLISRSLARTAAKGALQVTCYFFKNIFRFASPLPVRPFGRNFFSAS